MAAGRSILPVRVEIATATRGVPLSDMPASTARNSAAAAPMPQEAVRTSAAVLKLWSSRSVATLSGAVLAPGLGAQGATPADLAARFAGVRGVVLPAASRSVLAAGPDPSAVRAAAVALRDALVAAQ